uniref:Uncharacterized protein n=1 Tax=Panagrellus redivivus TaxID=6233 RepID=A0A7E4UXS5_PANRE
MTSSLDPDDAVSRCQCHLNPICAIVTRVQSTFFAPSIVGSSGQAIPSTFTPPKSAMPKMGSPRSSDAIDGRNKSFVAKNSLRHPPSP